MKTFFVIGILLCAFASLKCDSSEEIVDKIRSKYLKSFIKDKGIVDQGTSKIDEICPGASDKLKTAITSYIECDDKADDSLTVCEQIQKYAINCTKPLLDVLQGCLPATAKSLPDLGVKSLLSAADFVCKQNGEALFELFNPCLYEDDDDEDEECDKKALEKLKEFKDEIPSAADVCSLATNWRGCAEANVKKNCKNAKTKAAAMGIYDALVAPCSSINEVKTK